ncbi:unnamed protein product [Effrenium voratum]|nr:unnamed protein product [Effrenium voratum]|mmetsp:Transcript_63898/g.152690  ORF Transcript_63898/g.152690 Transcript_63898/m.152690 type:complete len:174 (+) Transcript_63898:56-577(+)
MFRFAVFVLLHGAVAEEILTDLVDVRNDTLSLTSVSDTLCQAAGKLAQGACLADFPMKGIPECAGGAVELVNGDLAKTGIRPGCDYQKPWLGHYGRVSCNEINAGNQKLIVMMCDRCFGSSCMSWLTFSIIQGALGLLCCCTCCWGLLCAACGCCKKNQGQANVRGMELQARP